MWFHSIDYINAKRKSDWWILHGIQVSNGGQVKSGNQKEFELWEIFIQNKWQMVSFEKIQHLSVMMGFEMDTKTWFEHLFEFMLLNENWMKWDNWLFVCCALGDPIIAGLYWISCKLLIVIQFLHQAGNQEKYKIANLFLHDFAIFLLSWFRSERLSCLKWKNIQLPVVFWDDL